MYETLDKEQNLQATKMVMALRTLGEVLPACRMAGISRATYHRWRAEAPGFAEDCDEAKEECIEEAVAEVRRRGVQGREEIVLVGGRPVYHVEEDGSLKLDDNFEPIPITKFVYSDKLLELFVKSKRSEFREKGTLEVTGSNGGPVQNAVVVEYVLPKNKTMADYDQPTAADPSTA